MMGWTPFSPDWIQPNLSTRKFALPDNLAESGICLTEQSASMFDLCRHARTAIESFYKLASLDGLGQFSRAMLSSSRRPSLAISRRPKLAICRALALTPISDRVMEIDPQSGARLN